MTAASKFRKGLAQGNAPEIAPGIAHCSNSDPALGPNDGDGITSARLEIIRSVSADHLVAFGPGIKNRDFTLLHSKLRLDAFEAIQNAASYPVFAILYFLQVGHVREVMIPHFSQQKSCVVLTSIVLSREGTCDAKGRR